ncbi:TROVE domain-containing protein [Dactylosporangium matsuzakiense]|uniref:RNA-binding protein n=1 Tax=Dactylosporangium matsuzakiense TaxID=53360 RepID=A0A9W6KR41_9ACTN|nr:TROVE domain-containing protein [Dactylosporangium matsuzakiense]UWZ46495.1 TROVE domain-containing protein [Dactylosporangium matsuzakiense]GLL06631.1 RNA-binding protein [Dactylosporangium matsuzakiense]
MAKLNVRKVRAAIGRGPVAGPAQVAGPTYEGGAGYARDLKSELFLLAVTNMVGEQTFYEPAAERDERYSRLVRAAAVADPDWTGRFLAWLRTGANMRTAAVVGAAEFVKGRLEAGAPSTGENRRVVADVLQRADEPGELLAYWMSRYGRAVPKPVKRGIADAVQRLYTERNLLKYDTASHAFRFGDVVDLTHPGPAAPWQGDLFAYALGRRHGREDLAVPASLGVIAANERLRADAAADPAVLLDAERLREAGMTWEDALSMSGGTVLDKAALWTALLPSMGYMARLRNLRNFDQAGVADDVAAQVAAKLADPEQVARSRQLPMRFLSAYRAAPSLRWSWALDQALTASLANVPALPGRTLVLIDTSGSMHSGFSRDGTLMRWDAAVVFGVALATRCAGADVVSFSTGSTVFKLRKGESVLKAIERFRAEGHFHGQGTNTATAVRKHFKSHDRVVILTDEQASFDGSVSDAVPRDTPIFTWNLAGYRLGHAPATANRWTFGGLSDAGFGMIPLLEAGRHGDWPF